MADAMQGIMSLPEASQGPANNTAIDPSLFSPVLQSYARTKPVEFGRDILGSMAASDPDLVAQFVQALSKIQISAEELDQLGQVIDTILADPESYPEIRQRLITEDDIPEDLLPEEFDPAFFTAFNIALDQLSEIQSAPQPAPMQMAKGGIATLTPMAFEIAKMGRNGDTMLAHIMPHEARMLRRRGGSGTINPKTGLPEFFLKGLFKGIGKIFSAIGSAVKSVLQSSVGKLVLTAAAAWFLGPMIAPYLAKAGITGALATGVNTFAASTLVNLASGASLGDALKGGAINGVLAGVGSKVFDLGKSYISSKTANVAARAAQSGDDIVAAAKTLPAPATDVAPPMDLNQLQYNAINTAGTAAVPDVPSFSPPTSIKEAISGQLNKPGFYERGMGMPMPSTSAAAAVAPSVSTTSAAAPAAAPVAAPPGITETYYSPSKFNIGKALSRVQTPTPSVAPPVIPAVAPPVVPNVAPTSPVDMGISLADKAGVGLGVKPTVGDIGQMAMGTTLPSDAAAGTLVQPGAGSQGIMSALRSGNYMDAAKQAYNYISPTEIQRQGMGDAIQAVQKQFPGVTSEQIINAPAGSVLNTAFQNAMPGMISTYGPMALAGTLGAAALGAFKSEPSTPTPGFSAPKGIDLLNANPSQYGLQFGGVRTSYAPNPYTYRPQRMAAGGIASLGGYAKGSMPGHFPRKTGPIDGPGTGTSDSIPAMLSDGEFVFTAKAVRAMGKGSRRAGAKKMYALMKALEKRA